MAPSHALPPIRLLMILAHLQSNPDPFTTVMEECTRVSPERTTETPMLAKILLQVTAPHL